MRFQQVYAAPRTFVIVFDPMEEVMSGLQQFCRGADVNAASFTAIGAFSSAMTGYYLQNEKKYQDIPVTEQVEVLSLIGDIVPYKNEPKLHAHVVLGKADGSACGGHLLSAVANPTLEVVVTELPAYLHREMNEKYGIPLIKI